MAYTPALENAKESIIRSLTGTKSWLQAVSNEAPSMDDAEVEVGTTNVTIMDVVSPAAISNKTGTAIVADKGASHTAACTTTYYYAPFKLFDYEIKRMQRLGTLKSEVEKYGRKAADAVFGIASGVIIDALSDGTIAYTATLADGDSNFYAPDEAGQILNMGVFAGPFGSACADNDGNLPDWMIAQTEAFGNLIGYSQNANAGRAAPSGPTQFMLRGVPLWAQGNGTAGKWGAASKACIFMGTNRSIVFRLNRVTTGEEFIFENGLWLFPIGITYTYCVDFTTTTGLARSVAEVINGVS